MRTRLPHLRVAASLQGGLLALCLTTQFCLGIRMKSEIGLVSIASDQPELSVLLAIETSGERYDTHNDSPPEHRDLPA